MENNKKYEGKTHPDEKDDWTGLEFLMTEGLSASWIAESSSHEEFAKANRRKHRYNQGEEREYARGMAQTGFLARHPRISAWLFVFMAYIASMYGGATVVPAVMGVPLNEAVPYVFGVEIIMTVLAIAFRNKVIRCLRKVQRGLFGKA